MLKLNPIIPFIVFLIFSSVLIFYCTQNYKLSAKEVLREQYVNQILALNKTYIVKGDKEVKEDNPDKSAARDYLMTMDISSGTVPIRAFNDAYGEFKRQKRHPGKRKSEIGFGIKQARTNLAGRTRAFMFDPIVEGKVWAGSVTGGLWVRDDFRDDNGLWNAVEGPWENLSVSKIVHDPVQPMNYYMGTGESYTAVPIYRESSGLGSGIWKSTDGGTTWEQIQSTIGFAYINDIVIRSEENQSVIYVAVASGSYKGGDFDSSPSDGLFRSTDNGDTWIQVLPSFVNGSPPAISDIELTTDNRLYVGTMRNRNNEGGAYLLYSDNGVDWQFTRTNEDFRAAGLVGGRVLVESAPSDPKRVYAIRVATIDGTTQVEENGIYRDTEIEIIQTFNRGESWSVIPNPTETSFSNIPWHALALTVHPQNSNHLITGALNLFSMENTNDVGSELSNAKWRVHGIWTGEIFAKSNPDQREEYQGIYVHADIHQLEFADEEGKELLVATDGGIFRTISFDKYGKSVLEDYDEFTFAGPVFKEINEGMATGQYYGVSMHPIAKQFVGGTQDNGTTLFNGFKVDATNKISGGDGGLSHFDKDDPLVITSIYHNLYYFNDAGYNPKGVNFNKYPSGSFVNATDYDDRINILYANGHFTNGFLYQENDFKDQMIVYNLSGFIDRSSVNGVATSISSLTTAETPYSAIKFSTYSPMNSSTLFIGTQVGRIFKVTGLPDVNVSSVELNTEDLPVGFISSIDVGRDENHLLVTFTNYKTNSVWLTRNGGETWESVERNLPDFPVRWGIFNQNNFEHIMLATEDGVWHNADVSASASEWQQLAGVPDVRVDMIKMRKHDRLFVAGTHGRGLFYGNIPESFDNPDPVINSIYKEELAQINIYPNPILDQFTVSFENKATSNIKIDLYDLNGKLIRGLYNGVVRGMFNQRFEATSLSEGVYLVVINDGKRKSTQKIVKR